jgi:hypothetical protein
MDVIQMNDIVKKAAGVIPSAFLSEGQVYFAFF